jgi:hypothetical protein
LGAVGILALDTASYVWGPILLRNLIRDLDFTHWPRVSDVWIVVDEPYGELPANDLSPPSYDAHTLFPAGFNPASAGWTQIQAASVPDQSATVLLLVTAFGGLAVARRRFNKHV